MTDMYEPRSQGWHIEHYRRLVKADAYHREKFGRCPAMPNWGPKPRSGALWSGEELVDLLERLAAMKDQAPLNVSHLAELGWHHGRSACGIEAKLKQLLGWDSFLCVFPRPHYKNV